MEIYEYIVGRACDTWGGGLGKREGLYRTGSRKKNSGCVRPLADILHLQAILISQVLNR